MNDSNIFFEYKDDSNNISHIFEVIFKNTDKLKTNKNDNLSDFLVYYYDLYNYQINQKGDFINKLIIKKSYITVENPIISYNGIQSKNNIYKLIFKDLNLLDCKYSYPNNYYITDKQTFNDVLENNSNYTFEMDSYDSNDTNEPYPFLTEFPDKFRFTLTLDKSDLLILDKYQTDIDGTFTYTNLDTNDSNDSNSTQNKSWKVSNLHPAVDSSDSNIYIYDFTVTVDNTNYTFSKFYQFTFTFNISLHANVSNYFPNTYNSKLITKKSEVHKLNAPYIVSRLTISLDSNNGGGNGGFEIWIDNGITELKKDQIINIHGEFLKKPKGLYNHYPDFDGFFNYLNDHNDYTYTVEYYNINTKTSDSNKHYIHTKTSSNHQYKEINFKLPRDLEKYERLKFIPNPIFDQIIFVWDGGSWTFNFTLTGEPTYEKNIIYDLDNTNHTENTTIADGNIKTSGNPDYIIIDKNWDTK